MELLKGFSHRIDNRFTLKIATDHKDEFEKILELNIKVHGEPVRNYLSRIFLEHPRKEQCLWFYIENTDLEKAVSSISLLPLEWKVDGIVVPICEMGFVGTLETYRKKGFIQELNKYYELAMAERGYIISVIRGIPYFYRKFGYEFALPLDNRMVLSSSNIPSPKLNHIKIRKANFKDVDFIEANYNIYYQNVFISNIFDRDSYSFKYVNEEYSDFSSITYIIEQHGVPVAFFTFGLSYDSLAFEIKTSYLKSDWSLKLLQFIRESYYSEDNKNLYLVVREDTELGKQILGLGGTPYQDYGWQVKIPNFKLFFDKIMPILEERLKNSVFKGLSQEIRVSDYINTILLSFANGKISRIAVEKGYPGQVNCDLQIPGPILFKLLLGDKNFDEIHYIIKDAMSNPKSKELMAILFPKGQSFPDSYY